MTRSRNGHAIRSRGVQRLLDHWSNQTCFARKCRKRPVAYAASRGYDPNRMQRRQKRIIRKDESARPRPSGPALRLFDQVSLPISRKAELARQCSSISPMHCPLGAWQIAPTEILLLNVHHHGAMVRSTRIACPRKVAGSARGNTTPYIELPLPEGERLAIAVEAEWSA